MIINEKAVINGKTFDHTYSDAGFKIARDGIEYDEAYDPEGSGRVYVETATPIFDEEATDEDYIEALERFGV